MIGGFFLAVLIYPGILVACLAALVLTWVREYTAAGTGGHVSATSPLALLTDTSTLLRSDSAERRHISGTALALVTGVVALAPLVALVLLPVPGNPLVRAVGLTGDLTAEGALLVCGPLARLLVGWASPRAESRAAADRGARLFAGAALPFVLALTVSAQALDTLVLDVRPTPPANAIAVVVRVLAAATFLCVLPVLVRVAPLRDASDEGETPDELAGQSGEILAGFRVGSAIQLVAVLAFFLAEFVRPAVPAFSSGGATVAMWIIGLPVLAAALGFWEGKRGFRLRAEERPPVSWWMGIPTLLGLAALVAVAWATRGA